MMAFNKHYRKFNLSEKKLINLSKAFDIFSDLFSGWNFHLGYIGLKATADQKRLCTISLIFTEIFKIRSAYKHKYQRRNYDPDKHLRSI